MIKTFDPTRDIKDQPSEIAEVITYGGSIFSGAIVGSVSEANVKRFNHWSSGSRTGSFYQDLYSTHHTASTAVKLMSVTFGYSVSSSFHGAADETNKVEKERIYKLFAKQLLGSEKERFTIDGVTRDELIFVSFARSQRKDELRKGTMSFKTINSGSSGGAGSVTIPANNVLTFTDVGSTGDYDETTRGDVADIVSGSLVAGRVYYQAGILTLVPEIISNTSSLSTNPGNTWSGSNDYASMVLSGGAGGSLDNTIDAMRFRLREMSIMNTTILHSSLFFCRALNDEFNYSSNPTFIDADGRIMPTSGSTNLMTRTYLTKVGLLGANNELLAVGSLSQPIKKAPDIERTVIVRLDY